MFKRIVGRKRCRGRRLRTVSRDEFASARVVLSRKSEGRKRSPSAPRTSSARADGGIVMAFVVTEPCHDCKYTDCVAVCPCECFYQDEWMLYIDPNHCIDCDACIPECPVEAIFPEAEVPQQWI